MEISGGAFRRLRNLLVHTPITTADSLTRWNRAVATMQLAERLAQQLESSHSQLDSLLEDTTTTRHRRGDDDVGAISAGAMAEAFLEDQVSEASLLGKLDAEEATRLGRRAAAQVRWAAERAAAQLAR